MGPASSSAGEPSSSSTGGGVMPEIPCTQQTCTGGDVCCVHDFNPSQDHCAAPGQCDGGFTEVSCNGPNDCDPNEVCCGALLNDGGYQIVECVNNCGNTSTTTGILMCGDEPSICPMGQNCYQSSYLPTDHGFCQ
jgi:hypothetical protein